MNNVKPTTRPARSEPVVEEKHFWDYARVLYKRRWIALPAFVLVSVTMTLNALRETPQYRAVVQVLIEKDAPTVATLDQMFQQDSRYYDDFQLTQQRILQSRSLAKRTIDSMNLWEVKRLGNGPIARGRIGLGSVFGLASSLVSLVKRPFTGNAAEAASAGPAAVEAVASQQETAAQSARISEFLGGLSVVPVKNTRLAEIRYMSTDPVFAAAAANAVANAYIQQNLELKYLASKDAGSFLNERLAEQKKATEASERALQEFKQKHGAVAINDGTSSIAVQQLTDINAALTKARTERISKEASYNQLKSAQASGTIDTLPAVLSNEYIQGLKNSLSEAQKQLSQASERYLPAHPEIVKLRNAVQAAEAKLTVEINKVVESVNSEYRAALAQEQSLQGAMNAQRNAAIGGGKMSVTYTVLQREADSNREIYESLLQRAKETGISGERRATNVRIVDPAEVPAGPVSPNVPRDVMLALLAGLVLGVGLAFGVEHLDNRIKTPQELKANINVPFLGMVPKLVREKGSDANPLLTEKAPTNFAEAFKSIRTNVLFSSAAEGMRTLVVTSAGPGEGKSVVASNLSLAMAQAGQRVLLIDADMRRPRVHEIFELAQEPGLSNVLAGNAKTSEAIRKSNTSGLWLMPAGHIPPNPAELLGSKRYTDFISSLQSHFDWVVIDTPPVMVVADASICANQSTGVVFVVGADHTSRYAARAAVEQLDAANAHLTGSVLNRVDLVRNPYYYSAYYRKEYARYYASASGR